MVVVVVVVVVIAKEWDKGLLRGSRRLENFVAKVQGVHDR